VSGAAAAVRRRASDLEGSIFADLAEWVRRRGGANETLCEVVERNPP